MLSPTIAWKPVGHINTPSSRLRCFLPCQYLRNRGWSCELFNPKNIDRYQLVVFQKTYDEENIALAKSLKSRGVKTVFDLCDNLFVYPDTTDSQRAKLLNKMIDVVDVVSVSTPEVEKLIQSKKTRVIDDAIDEPQINSLINFCFERKDYFNNSAEKQFKVVWYGSAGLENPPYGLVDLPRVLPFLEQLHSKLPVSLTVISSSETLFKKYVNGVSFPVKYYNWKKTIFQYLFKQHDVCIIPININPFTICKSNNRLILSLLLGVPVIADKIPSYEEFREFMLFSDWQNSLYTYATNQELRDRHITQAKEYISRKYNKDRVISQWSSLFQTLL